MEFQYLDTIQGEQSALFTSCAAQESHVSDSALPRGPSHGALYGEGLQKDLRLPWMRKVAGMELLILDALQEEEGSRISRLVLPE